MFGPLDLPHVRVSFANLSDVRGLWDQCVGPQLVVVTPELGTLYKGALE